MRKALLLRLCVVTLLCTVFGAMGGRAQGYYIWTPQDSLRFMRDSIQDMVNTLPDSTRHGFFHAARFNSTFHIQAEGDVGFIMGNKAEVTGFQAAWVINHKISIGLKYDVLSTQVRINKYINTVDTIGQYTSSAKFYSINPTNMSAIVNVAYIVRTGKKLTIEPAIGVGWTHVSFSDPRSGWIDTTEAKTQSFSTGYFVVNPTVSLIWNTTRYFRLGAVVGAKGVFGDDYLRLKSYRVGGVYMGLFMRFGTF